MERLTRRKENAAREMTVMKTEEEPGDEGKEHEQNETREGISWWLYICNNQKMETEKKRKGW